MKLLLFLAAYVACCLAQQFSCDFEMRQASMPSGFVRGVLNYDWPNHKILTTFTTSGTNELMSYNSGGGYVDYQEQYLFRWSKTCKCSIAAIQSAQPILFQDSRLTTKDSVTYTPVRADTGLTSVQFDAVGFPQTAVFTNGRTYKYSNCRKVNFPTDQWTTPSGCSCGKPIDIVLVLDRSCSISPTEFISEKQFTQSLVASFDYSPLNVNLGITNFHTLTWDGPVSLDQGNNMESVRAGASALQCQNDVSGQCITYQNPPRDACCGCGTCVSCGIVNGADMLAKASTTGVRAKAEKVLITLTDGYHNLLLAKNGDGTIKRGGNGKPSGNPYTVNGRVCTEDGAEQCAQALFNDLTYAVQYAQSAVPNVKMFSIGVGNIPSTAQLLEVAAGDQSRVFSTDDWDQLGSIVQRLVGLTCQATDNDQACGGTCCGFCSCGGCVAPDGCDAGNFCDDTKLVGTCCSSVAKPPSSCDGADKCRKYFCDKTLNNGKGACDSDAIDFPLPNDTCKIVVCDNTTGQTELKNICPPPPPPVCTKDSDCADKDECTVEKCILDNPKDPWSAWCQTTPCPPPPPPPPKCKLDTECDDSNACTLDQCSLATPGDIYSAFCNHTDRPPEFCWPPKPDLCFTYFCDPKTGCGSKKIPIPANTQCESFECIEGKVVSTDLCPVIPQCVADTGCDDKNECTTDKCFLKSPPDPNSAECVFTPVAADFCNKEDKCFTYICDPTKGCVSTPVTVPENTTCIKHSCDPKTGVINTTNVCPPPPPPLPPTPRPPLPPPPPPPICTIDKDCDDKNECTKDICNLTVAGDMNSAVCVWQKRAESECDDKNACTYDKCDAATGCVHEAVPANLCDDNDLCTADKCDPTSTNLTYPCIHEVIPCESPDVCHDAVCDPTAGCVISAVVCPVTDNCTISGCNITDNLGCYIESAGTCGAPITAFAGITAGVVAGIVIAAVAGAGISSGGTALAFSQAPGSGLNTVVTNNPLHKPINAQADNPFFKN